MKMRVYVLIALAAFVVAAADSADAGLFGRLRGGDCCQTSCCDDGGFLSGLRDRGDDCCCETVCCEPVCCEPAPTCCEPEPVCCEPAPTCCEPEPCCCEEKKCGLLSRLRGLRKKDDCCCESAPACECTAATECGCSAPVVSDCGCGSAPSEGVIIEEHVVPTEASPADSMPAVPEPPAAEAAADASA